MLVFFLFHSVLNPYKSQEMCEIYSWLFVTSKNDWNFHDSLLANDDILFFDEDFSNVTFYAIEMEVLGA